MGLRKEGLDLQKVQKLGGLSFTSLFVQFVCLSRSLATWSSSLSQEQECSIDNDIGQCQRAFLRSSLRLNFDANFASMRFCSLQFEFLTSVLNRVLGLSLTMGCIILRFNFGLDNSYSLASQLFFSFFSSVLYWDKRFLVVNRIFEAATLTILSFI